jgi:hypothetical protein
VPLHMRTFCGAEAQNSSGGSQGCCHVACGIAGALQGCCAIGNPRGILRGILRWLRWAIRSICCNTATGGAPAPSAVPAVPATQQQQLLCRWRQRQQALLHLKLLCCCSAQGAAAAAM